MARQRLSAGTWNDSNNAHRRRHSGRPGGGSKRLLFSGARGAPAPQKAAAPPPPDVSVIEIKRADVPLTLAYAGRVAGFRSVEIRAMVSGTIMKREYEEGARDSRFFS